MLTANWAQQLALAVSPIRTKRCWICLLAGLEQTLDRRATSTPASTPPSPAQSQELLLLPFQEKAEETVKAANAEKTTLLNKEGWQVQNLWEVHLSNR